MTDLLEDERRVSPSNDARDTIAGRFEQVVASAPDAPAVITAGGTLTYRELNALAGRIAAHLRMAQGADRPVAILMEKGPFPIAAMIGAAKAGRTFVPLELASPESWLRRVVVDSTASVILTDGAWYGVAKQITSEAISVCNVEELGEHEALPPVRVSPDSPACLFFTSGSTGRPKGVVQSHRSFVRTAEFRMAALGYGPTDRVAHVRSFGYSAGVKDIFFALFAGASLLPYDVRARGVAGLASWLEKERVTAIVMVSSFFRTWLASLPQDCPFLTLKMISAGAEPLYGTDIARAAKHLTGDWRIIHNLSSTETGTVATMAYTASSPLESGILPVGRVVPETRVWIEKTDGTQAKVGESGEIVVESRYLALGYWNDPALTEAVFTTRPDDPAIRVFRTGDLGRYRADGMLEHLGRNNRKIKLRGFSVEPYEIECALLELPDIRDATVIVVGNGPDARLAGYVVGPQDKGSGQAIRTQLAQRLPAHLVPAQIVILDAMPLTVRGKIDRGALPPPPDLGLQRHTPFRAARDAGEQSLAGIWQSVLKIENVGVDDDFYELGGTSLQAFLIFARIAAEFSRDLPPTTMLEAPTIAKQAELLRRPANETPQTLVPFRRTGALAPLFVVHARFGDIAFVRELARQLKSKRPVYGFQPPPLDGTTRLPRTMETFAALYIADMRKVQPKGPYHLAGYSFGGRLAYEMAQQLTRQGEEVSFLGLIDAHCDYRHEVPSEDPAARIRRHANALRRTPTSTYVLERVQKTIVHRLSVAREAARHLNDRLRVAWGRPIAYLKRSQIYYHVFGELSRKYSVDPYPGAVVMFASRNKGDMQREQWSQVAQGGVTVHVIPAEHQLMVWPPYSPMLAACFDEHLDRTAT